jgi:3-keto-L-gulonate-6-phosphate decarboxylase
MKLQISFDVTDLDNAIDLAKLVADHCDILEIGTLLIYKNGVAAVERFRETFPKKTLLADTKIIDRGKEAVATMASAGADWVTVMAGTGKEVIHSASTMAHQRNVKVMLDLVDSGSPGQSALDAKNLGADALLFHQAYDEKDALILLDKWEMIRGNTTLPIFVSAKITRTTILNILNIKPDGIVVGKSITDADDPAQEAAFYYQLSNE